MDHVARPSGPSGQLHRRGDRSNVPVSVVRVHASTAKEWTEARGAWCQGPKLWFVALVPAMVAQGLKPAARGALVFGLILSMATRACWATEFLSSRNPVPPR